MVEAGHDDEPVVRLERYRGPVGDDDFANLRAEVRDYGLLDPLETLRGLSAASGLSVGVLARYVLAKWASSGSEGLLELGMSGVDHLERLVEEAEAVGTDEARLQAYAVMREIVSWLRAGVDGS